MVDMSQLLTIHHAMLQSAPPGSTLLLVCCAHMTCNGEFLNEFREKKHGHLAKDADDILPKVI